TVNATLLLCNPPWLTTTLPVRAPLGTRTTMLVSDQLVTGADWPAKVTLPVPCDAPKPLPEIVIEAPGAPLVADKLLMDGAANAGKLDRSRTASNLIFRQCKWTLQSFLAFSH